MVEHSIIVPAYNTGNAIRKCIDSIIAQTYEDWELIVVDDGSRDDTPAIIDEYAAKDERIKAIHIKNGGVSNARNIGIDAAQGEYVIFVDSDDWIESDYLQQVENHMNDDADMYIVGITQDHEDLEGKVYYSEIKGSPIYRHLPSNSIPNEVGYLLNTINMESSCLKSYRASFLREHNIRFHKEMIIFEDFYFVLQCLLHKSSISLIPYIGYHYRMELIYNPVAKRWQQELYPSMKNLFAILDSVDKTLGLEGYSHETIIRIMTDKITVVLRQCFSAKTISNKIRPFKQIANDQTINARINEVLRYGGGRFRLQYKFMKMRLYYIAYLLYNYI